MNALTRERFASMARRFAVTMLAPFMLISAQGCSSAADADCILQVPGFGGYAVKMTLQGTTAGCPATIGDTWYADVYQGTWIFNSGSDDTISTVRPASDPAFGRGKFKDPFPDADKNCTMPTITPFVVRSTTPNSAASGTYTVTNLRALNTAVYAGQEFVADVTFTGGTCTGGKYVAQGMAPPVQCTTAAASICDPFAQPPNAVNPGFAQGCTTDAWAFSAAVAQNKTNEIYDEVFNQGIDPDPAGITQPDPGTGVCFLKNDFPSLGQYTP
jgi:hypothetical protein